MFKAFFLLLLLLLSFTNFTLAQINNNNNLENIELDSRDVTNDPNDEEDNIFLESSKDLSLPSQTENFIDFSDEAGDNNIESDDPNVGQIQKLRGTKKRLLGKEQNASQKKSKATKRNNIDVKPKVNRNESRQQTHRVSRKAIRRSPTHNNNRNQNNTSNQTRVTEEPKNNAIKEIGKTEDKCIDRDKRCKSFFQVIGKCDNSTFFGAAIFYQCPETCGVCGNTTKHTENIQQQKLQRTSQPRRPITNRIIRKEQDDGFYGSSYSIEHGTSYPYGYGTSYGSRGYGGYGSEEGNYFNGNDNGFSPYGQHGFHRIGSNYNGYYPTSPYGNQFGFPYGDTAIRHYGSGRVSKKLRDPNEVIPETNSGNSRFISFKIPLENILGDDSGLENNAPRNKRRNWKGFQLINEAVESLESDDRNFGGDSSISAQNKQENINGFDENNETVPRSRFRTLRNLRLRNAPLRLVVPPVNALYKSDEAILNGNQNELSTRFGITRGVLNANKAPEISNEVESDATPESEENENVDEKEQTIIATAIEPTQTVNDKKLDKSEWVPDTEIYHIESN